MALFKILGYVLLGIILFWLFGLKLFIKLGGAKEVPCPTSLGWLVDMPIRRKYMRPVLGRAGVRSGETVLELGPGPGAFTVDAARLVGDEGKLIAIDIQADMIAEVEKRIGEAGVKNVETHVASAYNLPIPDESVDRVFMVTVLPEIPDPVKGLREVFRILKPGGVFSTTEEFLDPDYPLRKTTIGWAEEAGFEVDERFGNWFLYTLNFRKP